MGCCSSPTACVTLAVTCSVTRPVASVNFCVILSEESATYCVVSAKRSEAMASEVQRAIPAARNANPVQISVSVTNNIQMAFFITKNYGVDLPAETYRLAASPQITIPAFLSKPHYGSTPSAQRSREGWCWAILSTGRTSPPTPWGLRLVRWRSGEGGVIRRRDYPSPCRWPKKFNAMGRRHVGRNYSSGTCRSLLSNGGGNKSNPGRKTFHAHGRNKSVAQPASAKRPISRSRLALTDAPKRSSNSSRTKMDGLLRNASRTRTSIRRRQLPPLGTAIKPCLFAEVGPSWFEFDTHRVGLIRDQPGLSKHSGNKSSKVIEIE